MRARKAKRLDPVRDPRARHLIHHILWLAREGLVMVEQYILPMVGNYVELRVLSYKLKASFYHIFVLFHNDPPVNDRINRSRTDSFSLFPEPLSPRLSKTSSRDPTVRSPTGGGRQRSPAISLGKPVGGGGGGSTTTARTPPGLAHPRRTPTPTATPIMEAASRLSSSLSKTTSRMRRSHSAKPTNWPSVYSLDRTRCASR